MLFILNCILVKLIAKKLLKNVLFRDTCAPKFMLCSCHENTELNFVLQYGSPRFLVETSEDYNPEEFGKLKKENSIFWEVELENGYKDLLLLVNLPDKEYITGKSEKQVFDGLKAIMDEMDEWYIDEMADLDSYEE
jgi:hypothetical protein